jgi:hypothetical protein
VVAEIFNILSCQFIFGCKTQTHTDAIANAGVPLANLSRFDGISSWARLTDKNGNNFTVLQKWTLILAISTICKYIYLFRLGKSNGTPDGFKWVKMTINENLGFEMKQRLRKQILLVAFRKNVPMNDTLPPLCHHINCMSTY